MPVKDLTGQRFGRWTVTGPAPRQEKPGVRWHRKWSAVCDCGNFNSVRGSHLTAGHSISCGCYQIDRTKETNTTHGHSAGRVRTKEYSSLASAIKRCNIPTHQDFERYGGRGIKVDECFTGPDGVINLIKEIGHRPSNEYSLDRINTNGHYEPGNVRWATAAQQARNRRDNITVTIEGVTKCLAEWAEEKGQVYKTVWLRYQRGAPLWVDNRFGPRSKS